jgi:hypothetical protein
MTIITVGTMFDLYKPFRNRLRNYSVVESLLSIFHFFQFLDFEVSLPEKLGAPAFLSPHDKVRFGLNQWEFEILAREIVLNGDCYSKKSLDSWSLIAREINSIKSLENETWRIHANEDDDILYELVRMSHRQFPWQKGISQPHIARYSRLYKMNGLDGMVFAEYQMTHHEILQIGFALAGHFLKNFSKTIPLKNEINNVSAEVCDNFIDRFSISMSDLRRQYQDLASYDINWAYTFNPLRQRPLILLDKNCVICPIPTFLIRRITNELYFDLVSKNNEFSKFFGPAVQALIGEVASKTSKGKCFKVTPEATYGSSKKRKDTVDWIISDDNACLFVEAKGARPHFRGTSDLNNHDYIDAEFKRIREFSLQLYKTLNDALEGKYPNWKPRNCPVYPIIVTLEDWQAVGIHIDRLVFDPLRMELKNRGIDPQIVDLYPLSFCSMNTFEIMMSICAIVGIDQIFKRKTQGQYQQWALDTYIFNNFKEELDSIKGSVFSEQWANLANRR